MKKVTIILLLIIQTMFDTTGLKAGGGYEPKKVPSAPMNLQKLTLDIYEELQKCNGSIDVGGRLTFYMDENDPNYFEFASVKSIGRSGERVIRFLHVDGKIYYAREIDYHSAKDAQGTLYEDLNGKWEKYLREKELKEKQQQTQ